MSANRPRYCLKALITSTKLSVSIEVLEKVLEDPLKLETNRLRLSETAVLNTIA
jgi:hypothetical protein